MEVLERSIVAVEWSARRLGDASERVELPQPADQGFELVKIWLTIFPRFIRKFSISAILGANLSRSKRPTDPVLSQFRLCCDFAPVTPSINAND